MFVSIFVFFIEAIKVCSKDTCQNGGICVETSQSNYECLCTEEYTGKNCECKIQNMLNY